MGVVIEGDLIGLQSNECQPKDRGWYRQVQGMGDQVVWVVDLFPSNNILQIQYSFVMEDSSIMPKEVLEVMRACSDLMTFI